MLRRYEMQLAEIRLLDYYGGAHVVPVEQYFQEAVAPDLQHGWFSTSALLPRGPRALRIQ